MKRVLYIGWIGYKNLGDELMFDLFKEQFKKLDNSYKLDSANIEYKYLKNVSIQDYDLIVLGGGSLLGSVENFIHPFIISYLYQCILLNKKVMIWGTGIDWVPKSLIEPLENNEKIPVHTSPELKRMIDSVFEESVWSGVRGPLTQKILKLYGIEKCHISGDPGFLLDRSQLSRPKNIQLAEEEKRIIGVNWGTSYNHIYGQDELKVEDNLAKALNQLIKQGYHIYLYTVWEADIPAMNQLYSKLSDQSKVTLDRTLYNHNELLSLMENFYFTINLKLHANYLSLAANVPFIALGYRFKVFDFVKSVGLEDYIISTDAQKIDENILNLEPQILNNQAELKTMMDETLKNYRNRILEPFKNGLYLE